MPVTQHSILPHRRGEADAANYKNRVRRQIAEHLKKNVGKEDVITGQGKIKVPVKGNKKYRLIHDRGPQGQGGEDGPQAGLDPGEEEYEVWLDMDEVEELLFQELDLPRLKPKKEQDTKATDVNWDTYAIQGPQIDKKATLRRNLKRNATQGKAEVGRFQKEDLRYTSYHEKPKPKSKAVIFLMMDVSASMTDFHKRIARLFFFWTVRFLRRRYDNVDVRFIAHTSEAKEVTEEEFFGRVQSGGTMVSSAYRMAQRMVNEEYPLTDWNVYLLHASDGDNWEIDNEEVFKAIKELTQVAQLVGYLEIKEPRRMSLFGGGVQGWSTLLEDLGERRAELGQEFMLTHVSSDKEIWSALRYFFAKEDVESYVA